VGAEGVAIVRRGILGAAIREGQLEGRAPDVPIPRERQILVDTSDPASSVLAPLDGLFEPLVALEDRVSRGQPVGNLHDFNRLDDPPLELPAPHDGYVICQAWGARVIQGQVLTQVGRTVPWTESEM
jgi:predicted deacylase